MQPKNSKLFECYRRSFSIYLINLPMQFDVFFFKSIRFCFFLYIRQNKVLKRRCSWNGENTVLQHTCWDEHFSFVRRSTLETRLCQIKGTLWNRRESIITYVQANSPRHLKFWRTNHPYLPHLHSLSYRIAHFLFTQRFHCCLKNGVKN
jgi:hypothetical protein